MDLMEVTNGAIAKVGYKASSITGCLICPLIARYEYKAIRQESIKALP